MSGHIETDAKRDGFALPVVLGFLFVVALSITPFVVQARLTLQTTHHRMNSDHLQALARGLLEVTVHQIVTGSMDPKWGNGSVKSCRTDQLAIAFSVQDHRGLVDINASGPQLLRAGFMALGMDQSLAQKSAQAVVSKRLVQRQTGQFVHDDWQIERPAGLFGHVLELADLRSLEGISPMELASVFTVHSKSGQVVKALAPSHLMEGLNATSTKSPQPRERPANAQHRSGVFTIGLSIEDRHHKTSVNYDNTVAVKEKGQPFQILTAIPGFGKRRLETLPQKGCETVWPLEVVRAIREFEAS